MQRIALFIAFVTGLLIAELAFADTYSVGPMGIDAIGIGPTLTGSGISIGMVEINRPGVPGYDLDTVVHDSVEPFAVFRNDLPGQPYTIDTAMPGESVGIHPLQVAGVMISTDVNLRGVAPDALLYASAFGDGGTLSNIVDRSNTSLQYLADLNFSDIRAINISYNIAGGTGDGNSQFTLFVDWSARVNDTLYVIGGMQTGSSIIIRDPVDNYNGMTIARSMRAMDGVYRLVDPDNIYESRTDNRTVTHLLAPGNNLQTTNMNNQTGIDQEGTSLAAPHVTGTVALLQEYAELRIPEGPQWGANARRHEVMKAVLMNSADKLKDSGDRKRLGMTRTVLDTNGNDWTVSDAGMNPAIPLHAQFGAGHLNARRAFQQFSPGEWSVTGEGDVPVIGWDYGRVNDVGDVNKYVFNEPLLGGSYVSATLVWDRIVLFETDTAPLAEFNHGDSFQAWDGIFLPSDSFNDLDLFLMPKGATDKGQAISLSISSEMNVEHIFAEVPTTGEYELWVEQFSAHLGEQFYALAWWAASANPPGLSGDYTGDTVVDIEDYNLWRSSFGSTTNLDADGNNDNVINAADYVIWRDNFGAGSGSGTVAAVPESSGITLFAIGLIVALPSVLRKKYTGKRGHSTF